MKPVLVLNTVLFCLAGSGLISDMKAAPPPSDNQDWPAYGGGPQEIRYSNLDQINRTNVARLQVAWMYDTEDGPGASETQPIVVNGMLFGLTPRHRVIALDAATGKKLWTFDSGIAGHGANRGLVYWADGDDQRIFAGVQSFLYALNARTGSIIPSFGKEGRIDLREGLGREAEKLSIVLTTPGIIHKDLLIVGGRDPENFHRRQATYVPSMFEQDSCAGHSTQFLGLASTATTPGRRVRGSILGLPITGPAWRWM